MGRVLRIIFVCLLLVVGHTQVVWAQDTEYEYIDSGNIEPDGAFAVNPDLLVAIEARAAMPKKNVKEASMPFWGLAWNCQSDGSRDYVVLCFGRDGDDDLTGRNCVIATRGKVISGRDSIIFSKKIFKGFDFARGYNSLSCEWKSGYLYVLGGNRHVEPLFSLSDEEPPHNDTCRLLSADSLSVECVVLENTKARKLPVLYNWTADMLNNRFAVTTDALEGYWEYFDLQAQYENARPGGRYRFAIVRSSERTYDILYMGGATVNADSWNELMLKGRLIFTPFKDNYTLEWSDAMFQPVDYTIGANATVVNSSLLSLQFPLYKFILRLAKVSGK